MRNQMFNMMKAPDNYFIYLKNQMIQQLVSMGIDPAAAQYFIDNVGFPDHNPYWANFMQVPNY